MTRVRTGSRLHFGLIDPAGVTGRRFGGVGLMVESPGVELSIEPASGWSVVGPLASRGEGLLMRLLDKYHELRNSPQLIRIYRTPPEHKGLGTGTQLSLAIVRAIAEQFDWNDRSIAQLARLVGRGGRSAIGIHGFGRGGFLVDDGKCRDDEIGSIAAPADFPSEWPIVLVTPPKLTGLHAEREKAAFSRLKQDDGTIAERLRKLVHECLVPALRNRECDRFGNALYEFNRLAGEPFASIQGSCYANPAIRDLVEFMRRFASGVGQSSWGPTVFAVMPDSGTASKCAGAVCERFVLSSDDVIVTKARNQGASVWRE